MVQVYSQGKDENNNSPTIRVKEITPKIKVTGPSELTPQESISHKPILFMGNLEELIQITGNEYGIPSTDDVRVGPYPISLVDGLMRNRLKEQNFDGAIHYTLIPAKDDKYYAKGLPVKINA